MSDLTYGAGIRILDQAVAIVLLLSRARDVLVLADQLQPKIEELSKIKADLGMEVDKLSHQQALIIERVEQQKAKIIATQAAQLEANQDTADRAYEASNLARVVMLDKLQGQINEKTAEIETLEKTFKERKSALDAEISSLEARLEKAEKKRAEMKAIL